MSGISNKRLTSSSTTETIEGNGYVVRIIRTSTYSTDGGESVNAEVVIDGVNMLPLTFKTLERFESFFAPVKEAYNDLSSDNTDARIIRKLIRGAMAVVNSFDPEEVSQIQSTLLNDLRKAIDDAVDL